MKISYYDLIGEYKELYDEQSDIVKTVVNECKDVNDLICIKQLDDFLLQKEIEYTTYSHN